jgi:hypothetical protein
MCITHILHWTKGCLDSKSNPQPDGAAVIPAEILAAGFVRPDVPEVIISLNKDSAAQTLALTFEFPGDLMPDKTYPVRDTNDQ